MIVMNDFFGNLPLLSLLTFTPLLGALLVLSIRVDEKDIEERNCKRVTLWFTIGVFVASLFLLFNFDIATSDFQFVERYSWFPSYGIYYHVGVDGISVLFILLSTFLMPICILASWDAIKTRIKEYMVSFLILETMMIGMFASLDLILFYIFFEGVLIPMFLIIGVWGGSRRVYSAFKFFLYTLTGSVLLLVAIIFIYLSVGSTDIPLLMDIQFPFEIQTWLWLALFASFAVKVPMWPLHTWLPDAHVEAPTAGSVILAGVLLKMGGYGFLRLSIPILPLASEYFTPFVFTLSIIAVVYTSLVALVQEDMKKLIAYSSVAHMGYVTVGIFALNQQAVQGSIFQMLSHGIVSSALFLCVGVVYDQMHTRNISRYGGLADSMPRYAFVFMLMMLASVGLPGTSGFVGEFLVLIGVFKVSTWVSFFMALGVVLGATYMLYLYRRVLFGSLVKQDLKEMVDLNLRETIIFIPLCFLVLFMGIYPNYFLNIMEVSVSNLIDNYKSDLIINTSEINNIFIFLKGVM